MSWNVSSNCFVPCVETEGQRGKDFMKDKMFHVKPWPAETLNAWLGQVIAEARALGIPVSARIEGKVVVNHRAKARFGCCRKLPGITGARFQIEISKAVQEAPEPTVRSILAHEILHTCPGCMNHQARWQSFGEAMGKSYGYTVSRTGTYPGLGLSDPRIQRAYRYVICCEGCGRKIFRQRKSRVVQSPHLYRCRCGGLLRLEEL